MVGTPAFDTVLDLCRDQHRRIVLATLTAEQRSLTVRDLSKAIVTRNHHTPVTEASGEVLERIRHSLHHVHLPKLADAGVIEYDTERQLVEPTDRMDQLEPTLSTILDADPALETPARV